MTYQSEVTEPPPDIGVYLDTNVLLDLADALDPSYRPPLDLDEQLRAGVRAARTERQKVAAARIFFYFRKNRGPGQRNWYLVISGTARSELTARGSPDWTLAVFADMDEFADASPGEVDELAAELQRRNLRPADADHFARVVVHEWVELFVTNDDKLRKACRALDLPPRIRVLSAIDAEHELRILAGETPATRPAPSSPLVEWWIPGSVE